MIKTNYNKYLYIIYLFLLSFFLNILIISFLQGNNITNNPIQDKEQNNLEKKSIKESASIRILNKITSKSFIVKLTIGKEEEIGNLKIKIFKCTKSRPDEPKEAKILLQVKDILRSNKGELIFAGWLFSSSPSLSFMSHSIYDIVAIDCFI